MNQLCYKCSKQINASDKKKEGLHLQCYVDWFDNPNQKGQRGLRCQFDNDIEVDGFANLIPRETESGKDFQEKNFNSSFFLGAFKKYSASLDNLDYILKIQTDEYPELPKSEYLCNQIAKLLKIEIANFYLIKFQDNRDCFVTYNFMQDHKDSDLVHIWRYTNGNHSVENIVKIIDTEIGKRSSMVRFIEMCLFDSLIGNNDRHGRNIGFIQSRSGKILAPCYDNPSYLSIEDEDFLGADLIPAGCIYTSESKEPTMKDYVKEFARLGYKTEAKEFFDKVDIGAIQKIIEESFILPKRKLAFSKLILRRYNELKNELQTT